MSQLKEPTMIIAILNDGTDNGDGSLVDWTPIPVNHDEIRTVSLQELIDRRHDAIVPDVVPQTDWDEFYGEENEDVERAFILTREFATRLFKSAAQGQSRSDSESYAVNSAIIHIMEEFSLRVVEE